MAWGDKIQDKTNSGKASSVTVTLDSTPTEGNLLIAAAMSRAASMTTPTGYMLVHNEPDSPNTDCLNIYCKIAGSGESTSIIFSDGDIGQVILASVHEFEGSWESTPTDKTNGALAADSDTISTGSTGTLSQADELVFAVATVRWSENDTDLSGTSIDNSFTEITDGASLVAAYGGSYPSALTTAYKIVSATTAQNPQFTFTYDYGRTSDDAIAAIATFKKASSGDTIALDTLALAGAVIDNSISPGAVSLALDLLTLTGTPVSSQIAAGEILIALDTLIGAWTETIQDLAVIPGEATTILSALELIGTSEVTTIVPGAIIADLNQLELIAAIESLTVGVGAVALELGSLSLIGGVESLTIAPGGAIVALDVLDLSGEAQTLLIGAGIILLLDTLDVVATAPNISILAALLTSLQSLSLAVATPGVTVNPGAVAVVLDLLAANVAAENISLDLSIRVLLTTLGLTGSAIDTTSIPGAVQILLDSLSLAASPQALSLGIGALVKIIEEFTIYSPGVSALVLSPENTAEIKSPLKQSLAKSGGGKNDTN